MSGDSGLLSSVFRVDAIPLNSDHSSSLKQWLTLLSEVTSCVTPNDSHISIDDTIDLIVYSKICRQLGLCLSTVGKTIGVDVSPVEPSSPSVVTLETEPKDLRPFCDESQNQ